MSCRLTWSAVTPVPLKPLPVCDTPVYRYAMYKWLPAPYEVYYFHSGDADVDAINPIGRRIEELTSTRERPANLVFLPINLQEDPTLESSVHPDVRNAWNALKDPPVPGYLVLTPNGVPLHAGELELDQFQSIVDSEARQRVGRHLEDGNACVFVLVRGNNAAQNAAATRAIETAIAAAKAGKVTPVADALGNLAPEKQTTHQVSQVSLDRDDPQESWLIQMLLGLEPDLASQSGPMVFTVFGRGRAFFSCLGEGIDSQFLIRDIQYVTGACSCTVKEQNPGTDLLMPYHWNLVAEILAEQFGSEEGNESQLGGEVLFPELAIPQEDKSPNQAQPEPGNTTLAGRDAQIDAAADNQPAVAASGSNQPNQTLTSEPAPTPDASKAASRPQLAQSSTPSVSPSRLAGTVSLMLLLGTIGLAFLVLLGATFVLMRPRA